MPDTPPHRRPATVRLRPFTAADLPALFLQQLDPDANSMAATHPRSAEAFDAHWASILANPAVVARAILADGTLVGQISCFQMHDQHNVGYWIAKPHWNRAIATHALALLLKEVPTRPLHAQVARHNLASLRVLQRTGFTITAHRHAPATDRFPACEEVLLTLT